MMTPELLLRSNQHIGDEMEEKGSKRDLVRRESVQELLTFPS